MSNQMLHSASESRTLHVLFHIPHFQEWSCLYTPTPIFSLSLPPSSPWVEPYMCCYSGVSMRTQRFLCAHILVKLFRSETQQGHDQKSLQRDHVPNLFLYSNVSDIWFPPHFPGAFISLLILHPSPTLSILGTNLLAHLVLFFLEYFRRESHKIEW